MNKGLITITKKYKYNQNAKIQSIFILKQIISIQSKFYYYEDIAYILKIYSYRRHIIIQKEL